jgi:hypothetical protein
MIRSLSVLLCLLLAGGCSSSGTPQSTPSSPGVAVVPADPSATEDVPGALACGTLVAAIKDGTLMEPGIVETIVTSASTADAPIADAAQRLRDAFAAAAGSIGTDNEADAVAAVSAAGADMLQICDESGLQTVG